MNVVIIFLMTQYFKHEEVEKKVKDIA